MTPLVEHIRNNVRNNSDKIRKIKDQAIIEHTYVNPKYSLWNEYQGRKHEVTKWIIALHQAKGEFNKIKYHLYKQPDKNKWIDQPREALKCMLELKEKVKKSEILNNVAESGAKVIPSLVSYEPTFRVGPPEKENWS